MSVAKNKLDFSIPLTKEEIRLAQEKKERERQKVVLDLGELIAKNKGLIPKMSSEDVEATPIVNGYKMLKDSPENSRSDSSFSSFPNSSI